MNLILFGFKRCGKTFYGKELARQLHLPFIDSDRLIEARYAKQEGSLRSCRDIYLAHGESFFRKLEEESITELQPQEPSIIAIGGGAILNPLLAQHLSSLGILVYLELDKESLKKRMLSADLPSYIDPNEPEASFEQMYQQRKPIYESIRSLRVTLSCKKDEEIIKQLIHLFKEHCHG